MKHMRAVLATFAVLIAASACVFAADLSIAGVDDGGSFAFVYRKVRDVESVETLDGFVGNTSHPIVLVPIWNNTGAILYYNRTNEFRDSITVVSNTLQTITGPNVAFNDADPVFSGYSYDAWMPQDENGRYVYFGEAFVKKIDLWNNSAVVTDANWPASNVCYDFGFSGTTSGFAANSTHMFISCYSGTGGMVFGMSRTNTSDRFLIHLNDTRGQIGQLAMDENNIYWGLWPGTTIGRYNFKTGVLNTNWTSLPDYGVVSGGYGLWRLRMYRENGTYVLWAQIYPDLANPFNCLRRVNPMTGEQLSVVWNSTELCVRNLNDFFIAPNGEISYVHQPVVPLPAPVAPPVAAPVAASVSAPNGAPSASAPSVSAPSASANTPTVRAPSSPSAPKTPSSSAAFTLPSIVGLICIVLSLVL
jgi:hypothetical protein